LLAYFCCEHRRFTPAAAGCSVQAVDMQKCANVGTGCDAAKEGCRSWQRAGGIGTQDGSMLTARSYRSPIQWLRTYDDVVQNSMGELKLLIRNEEMVENLGRRGSSK
jgi:hypothetical protein